MKLTGEKTIARTGQRLSEGPADDGALRALSEEGYQEGPGHTDLRCTTDASHLNAHAFQ